MSEEFTKANLSSFLENIIHKGLTLEEAKKALVIKGWSKKFVNKYCKKYYNLHKKRMNLIREKSKSKAEEKENYLIDEEIAEIDEKLARLR